MDAFRRNPLFLPLLAVLAGMVAEVSLPGEPSSFWLTLLLIPGFAVWIFQTAPKERRAIIRRVSTICCFFGGAFWLCLHPLPSPPSTNAEPGERVVVEGCVDSAIRREPERVQFAIRLEDGHRLLASIYPRKGETPPAIRFGQPAQVEGRIRPPRNFQNPGSFDYERFLFRQNTFWLVAATGVENLRPGAGECGPPALMLVQRARASLLDRLHHRFAERTEARAWLSAILLGDDAELPDSTLESYRLAGVYHVLVISGQHIAIMAGAFLLIARFLPLPRWLGFVLVVVGCWTYALISGYEIPAVRAACGITLYLAGSLAYRRARPLNLLSLIALIFLAWDPGQLLDASFQLSFLAVLAIAGIAAPLQRSFFGEWPQAARRLADVGVDLRLPPSVAEARVELRLVANTLHLAARVPERFCRILVSVAVHSLAIGGSLLLISVVVQAVLTPLLATDFHRVALSAPLANLLLSPVLGLLVPVAFVDLLLPLPCGQDFLSWMVSFTNGMVGAIAAVTPDLRMPDVATPLLFLATALALAAILAWEPLARVASAQERRAGTTFALEQGARSMFHSMRAPSIVFGTLVAAALILSHPFPARLTNGDLELTMLDVGQGDSTLVVTPGGKIILIDTGGLGGSFSASRLDTGEDVVAPYLWHRGIRNLDTLILSHLDFDHAGGAPAILRIFRPKELWIPATPTDHALWETIRATAASLHIPTKVKRAGRAWETGGLMVQVLHPGDYQELATTSNEASLVLHLQYGKRSALFTGDIDRQGEASMLGSAEPVESERIRADVLKVAHHGSRTSTTEDFLEAANPAIALISVGWLNSYRHPSPEVVRRIESRRTAILRTDRDGAITLRCDGNRWVYATTE